MKKTLFISILLLLSFLGYAQTFTVFSSGISYEIIPNVTSNQVKVLGYNASSGSNVVIPSVAINPTTGTKYSVIEVGVDAFRDKGLTSVTLANTIKKIDLWAFAFNNLTSVTLPNNLERLVGSCFRGNSITTIDFGSSPDINLGNSSFSDNQLTNITIPGSISAIGNNVFGDNNITSITFEQGVGTVAVGAFWGNPLTEVICNSTVPPTIYATASSDTYRLNNTEISSRSSIDLIIPVGTTGVYVTDQGALWTGFKSVTEDPVLGVSYEWKNDLSISVSSTEIEFGVSNGIEIEKFALYDMSGKIIEEGAQSELFARSLTNGVYILKLTSNKGTMTRKYLID